MGTNLVFRESGVVLSGRFEVEIVARKADSKKYRSDKNGTIVSLDGQYLHGIEDYASFKRNPQKFYEFSSFVLRVSGHVVRLPRKELDNIIVMTLRRSKDPNNYESGVRVFSSKTENKITVVLAGGDGVASFIKVWVFDAKKGFIESSIVGPP